MYRFVVVRPMLTYYGGKQKMAREILSIVNQVDHRIYCEPFMGGGTVYFMKEPVRINYLNDLNDRLMIFYRVVVERFDEMVGMVEHQLYSESDQKRAYKIWKEGGEDLEVAWAVWFLSITSFGGSLDGSFKWKPNVKDDWSVSSRLRNRKQEFGRYRGKLDGAVLFCRDALEVIEGLEQFEGVLYYLDPPYIGAQQGHYRGYSEEDFLCLIEKLKGMKNKFVLSSYWHEGLEGNGWQIEKFDKQLNLAKGKKVEVVTTNFAWGRVSQSKLF